MKVRVVEVEGTPEELAQLDINKLLSEAPSSISPAGAVPSDEVAAFLAEVRSWEGVEVIPGRVNPASGSTTSYLRVHRLPRRLGAFVYVYPGQRKVNFRLGRDALEGTRHARARDVKDNNAYQLTITVVSREALAESLHLARLAYQRVATVEDEARERRAWEEFVSDHPVGETVQGRVVAVVPFGAFVEMASGVQGLIHISEMGQEVDEPGEVLAVGDDVRVRVLALDRERQRLSLSLV